MLQRTNAPDGEPRALGAPVRRRSRRRSCWRLSSGGLLAFVLLAGLAAAQRDDDEDDENKPPEEDPYTEFDEDLVRELGYDNLGGPFLITRSHNTESVEETLGRKWMLWAETEHFQIGSTLGSRFPPRGDRELAKRFDAELDRLRDRGLKLPRKVKDVDAWLHLHLFAQRLEDTYDEFERIFGVTPDSFPPAPERQPDTVDRSVPGPYLGSHHKYIVLLFEEKSDLARYLARYTGQQRKTSFRYLFQEDDANLFITAREVYAISKDEFSHFHCHVVGNVFRLLVSGYRGFRYNVPPWFLEGLAHWTTRRLDPTFFSPTVPDGQDADYRRDPEWEDKVYARVKNDYWPKSSELMTIAEPGDMKFADHLMSWSRMDFLLSRESGKPGLYLDRVKSLPWRADLSFDDVREAQERGMEEAWGLDYDTLDAEWAEWVKKAYRPGRRKR